MYLQIKSSSLGGDETGGERQRKRERLRLSVKGLGLLEVSGQEEILQDISFCSFLFSAYYVAG